VSNGEPLAVVVGEGVVALVSAFESRDGDERDAEMGGDGGQGEVFGLSGRPQVAVFVDRVRRVCSLNISRAMARLSSRRVSSLVRPLAS